MARDENAAAWMRHAIMLAQRGNATSGANGIGCVIVQNGCAIGEGYNEVSPRRDCLIQRAGQRLQCHELRGAVLYTTLQPCGMCTMASIWAKIGRIVYGAGRDDVHSEYFEDRHLDTMDFIRDAFRNDLSLEGGLMRRECAAFYPPPDADVPKDEQFNQ